MQVAEHGINEERQKTSPGCLASPLQSSGASTTISTISPLSISSKSLARSPHQLNTMLVALRVLLFFMHEVHEAARGWGRVLHVPTQAGQVTSVLGKVGKSCHPDFASRLDYKPALLKLQYASRLCTYAISCLLQLF